MSTPDQQPGELDEARELILALCDRRLEPASEARLDALMLGRADVRRLYLEIVRVHTAMFRRAESASTARGDELDDAPLAAGLSDAMVMPALDSVDAEDNAAVAPPSHADSEPTAARAALAPGREEKPPGWLRRGGGWRAAAAVIFLAGAIALVETVRRLHSPATIVAAADAQFAPGRGADVGDLIGAGKVFRLSSGCVELKFRRGADVVIEGPAVFNLTSPSSLTLTSGKISATATGAAHGFVVQTPTARVTDLGTEFGVTVDADGGTKIDVFAGKVQVAPDHSNEAPTTLCAGDAAAVDHSLLTRSAGDATPQSYIRSLAVPPSLDVVDLIAGGDGTTHRRSGAIDQRTGDSGALDPVGIVDAPDNDYHAVPNLPVINGCFVPDGETKIDGAGHSFDFGDTSGATFYQIRSGGRFPWPQEGETFTGVVGGVDYSQGAHGLMLLHPCAGITFDLGALRRLHPGLNFTHFRALAGNSCGFAGAGPHSDLFVFVDGAAQVERRGLTHADGPVNIDVAISDSDRFLTLVTTNAGGDPSHNWIIFGDPKLE